MEPIENTPGGKAVVMSYTPVTEDRKDAALNLKRLAAEYFNGIVAAEEKFGRSRDLSLAKTHVQDASMWATRGLFNPE
jgi:hypothetical protein